MHIAIGSGLPKLGPHGIDTSRPRGVTRSKIVGLAQSKSDALKRAIAAKARPGRAEQ